MKWNHQKLEPSELLGYYHESHSAFGNDDRHRIRTPSTTDEYLQYLYLDRMTKRQEFHPRPTWTFSLTLTIAVARASLRSLSLNAIRFATQVPAVLHRQFHFGSGKSLVRIEGPIGIPLASNEMLCGLDADMEDLLNKCHFEMVKNCQERKIGGWKRLRFSLDKNQSDNFVLEGEFLYNRHCLKGSSNGRTENVILYFHGGGYTILNRKTYRGLTTSLVEHTGTRVFAVDYRLAPEHAFPAPLIDAISAYYFLSHTLSIHNDNRDTEIRMRQSTGVWPITNGSKSVILMGDSAGGNLALSMMLYLRDHGFELPQCAVLLSPWLELSCTSPGWERNKRHDYIPRMDLR
jgi:hypothetical protein